MTFSKHLLASWRLGGFFLFFSFLATQAHAQDVSSPEYVEARQRLQEGKTLYGQGNIDGARLKFEQACAVLKTPACERALGLAQFYTKRYLEALGNLQRALEDRELDTVQRKQVTDLMTQAYDKTGHLEVRAPAGGRVRIDDTTDAGNAPLREVVHVTVGAHVVSVTVEEKTERLNVDCSEGKIVKVDFSDKFPGLSVDNGHVGTGVPEPHEVDHVRTSVGWVVPIVAAGLGVVGIGMGIGFASASQSAHTSAVNMLAATPGICANLGTAGCVSYKSQIDSQNSSTAVSIAGYVAGAALLTTAVILWVVWPKASIRHEGKVGATFVPSVSPGGMSMSLVGRF
jgi:hypothetical protein